MSKHPFHQFASLLVLVTISVAPPASRAQVAYSLVDLGTLGGPDCRARAINNLGQVVGDSQYSPGSYHAFLYANGVMTDLGSPPGSANSYAHDINNAGLVVGQVGDGTTARAFAFANGSMTTLGTLGGQYSSAYAVNDLGVITGGSYYAPGVNSSHVFHYSNGVMTDLGSPTTNSAGGYAINNLGQIIAQSTPTGSSGVGTYRNVGGTWQDIGSLGGDFTIVGKINDAGQIVGTSELPDGACARTCLRTGR